MPKLGMEPVRRAALVDATIEEIGAVGSLDVTVSGIARRAGVSSALAHHYFGGKDDLLIAAMRQILLDFGTATRAALRGAKGPRARIEAVIGASFADANYRPDVVAAWLNFYVQAQRLPQAQRLLTIYHRRLTSTLIHDLRALVGDDAPAAAETIAALIDGIYIRTALGRGSPDGQVARARVLGVLAMFLGDAT